MIEVYGIKNCDTVKKARHWLEKHGVEYRFHDVREEGLSRSQVQHWLDEVGVEALVNRRSTTWKTLDAAEQERALSATAADVLLAHPTLIKRPVITFADKTHVGFQEAAFHRLFEH